MVRNIVIPQVHKKFGELNKIRHSNHKIKCAQIKLDPNII